MSHPRRGRLVLAGGTPYTTPDANRRAADREIRDGMILTCPQCATRYQVDPAGIGPQGRVVRCSKCGHSWTQMPPVEAPHGEDGSAAPAEPAPIAPPEAPAAAPTSERTMRGLGAVVPGERPVRRGARARRPERASPLARALWVLLAVTVATTAIAAVVWRDAIIQTWPAAAPLYEQVGLGDDPPDAALGLGNVSWKAENRDGIRVLSVEGEVANLARIPQMVPPIHGVLYDKEDRVLQRWTFAAPAARLGPGERIAFHSELPNPAPGAARLEIRFETAKKTP